MALEIEKFFPSLKCLETRKGQAIVFSILFASGITIKILRKLLIKTRLKQKRRTKQRMREVEFSQYNAALLKISAESVSNITRMSAGEIVDAVKSGKYKALEVLQAFQCKALEAQKKTNCLTGFIQEAQDEAKTETDDKKDKLLYGLPVSIKENYLLQGYDSTIGCSKLIDLPHQDEDCVLVQVLRDQGAVVFARTNVPQTMLSWQTSNPIYGTTCNPHAQNRTAGGSSGGEGALIGSGGSVLGWGSDIGGSIRIPAAMCGVCGFKPTSGRLSSKGTTSITPGQTMVKSTFGPMARDVDSLVLGMKAVLVPKMWELDPFVAPMPFNDKVFNDKRSLRIGYFRDIDYLAAAPSMHRAVDETITHLRELGHSVSEYTLPNDFVRTVGSVWLTGVMGDTGTSLKKLLDGDAVDSAMASLMPLIYMPRPIKRILSSLIRPLGPFFEKLSTTLSASCGASNVYDWWICNEKCQELKFEMLKEWKKNDYDVMICPGFPCAAALLETPSKCPGAAAHTLLWNALDFPAGSMPVTTVTPKDELEGKNYPTPDPWHSAIKKAIVGSTGLPVNIQVIGKPWEEELVLRVMKEIEQAVHKD